jgi:glycerol 2-dehydrogenase (NADP+)/D-galacturonate reductase
LASVLFPFPSKTTAEEGKLKPKQYSGTWQSKPGEVQAAVSYALKSGYKLVDCAYVYGNEDEVGKGLKEAFDAGIKREDIYIMTKVWASYNTRVEKCLDKSLKSLGVDYVDMYLVVSTLLQHSPLPPTNISYFQHWPVLMNPNGMAPLFLQG